MEGAPLGELQEIPGPTALIGVSLRMAIAAVVLCGWACVVEAPDDPAGVFGDELAPPWRRTPEQQEATAVPGRDGWLFFGTGAPPRRRGAVLGDDAPQRLSVPPTRAKQNPLPQPGARNSTRLPSRHPDLIS
jgi:hypothetical protein